MQIDIQVRRFSLTEGLRRHVVRRLEHALRRYKVWVQCVEVQLKAATGPDKACLILVRLQRLPAIVIQDLGADLYAVIDRAAARARRSVARRMAQRMRTKRLFGISAVSRAQSAGA